MGKTYNSRWKINNTGYEKVVYPNGWKQKFPYGETIIEPGGESHNDWSHTTLSTGANSQSITNTFSRHPNKKNRRHTLNREWKGVVYYIMSGKDGRLGDCYDRSDRQRGGKKSISGLRRAKSKEDIRREIESLI